MREFISWLKEEESGQGMVEYGVIVVLIVGIAIAVLASDGELSTAIKNMFTKVGTKVNAIP